MTVFIFVVFIAATQKQRKPKGSRDFVYIMAAVNDAVTCCKDFFTTMKKEPPSILDRNL